MTGWLTIDDGTSALTPRMLDFLAAREIAPVLFLWGQRLEAAWAEGIDALRRGVLVGNHSYAHPAFSRLTYDEAVADIRRQEALLERLHAQAGVPRRAKLFRFPYCDAGGENEAALQAFLLAEGFRSLDQPSRADTMVTFDPQEYRMQSEPEWTIADVLARIETLRGQTAHQVVLIHDHPESEAVSPGYFETAVDAMLAAGVRFVPPEA